MGNGHRLRGRTGAGAHCLPGAINWLGDLHVLAEEECTEHAVFVRSQGHGDGREHPTRRIDDLITRGLPEGE